MDSPIKASRAARTRDMPQSQEAIVTKRNRALSYLISLLAVTCGSIGAQAQVASPSFTLTARNTAMPSSGFGFIPFTLTAVNGYTGSVLVACEPPSPPAGANIPTCGAPEPYGNGFPGGLVGVSLTADSPVASSSVYIYALPASLSASWNPRLRRLETEGTVGWALAGVLMLGLGLWPRKTRCPARLLPAMVMLIALMGVVACAGPFPKAPTLTPGTYTYTVTALGVGTSLSTSTTVTVTVPQGIVVL
jgi:hypothetical protein